MTAAAIFELIGGVRAAAFLALFLVAGATAGVQTWRLGNAQDDNKLLRVAVDSYATAQATNMDTIAKLRRSNEAWAESLRADRAAAEAVLEVVRAERDELARWKDTQRAVRRKIYADDPVAATWGRARVPARVADRMRQ